MTPTSETYVSAASGHGGELLVAGWRDKPHRGVYLALLLTSTALLNLEISFTRFFSFTIWYHFAYLTISVALLGFGSTGALVAAFPQFVARRGERFLVTALVLAAMFTIGGLCFLAQFPIEVENLVHKPLKFSASLLVYYFVVGAPFLLSGFAISVPFAAYPNAMGRLYFWDLLGAAAGCAITVWLIELFTVPGLIFASAGILLMAAAAIAWSGGRAGPSVRLAAAGTLVLVLAAPAGHLLPVSITSSKHLASYLAAAPGVPPFEQRADRMSKWTAINRVDAFGWDTPSPKSWWSGIGVGKSFHGEFPQVSRLAYDGSNGSDVYEFHGDIDREFEFLDHHLLTLPYLLLDKPNVVAIGVGGGVDLFNAIKHGARHVTGVELQSETVKLLHDRLRTFNSGFYDRGDVTLVAGEGRHFMRRTNDTFDLVQITAVDTFAAQAAGAYVLAESYLYTVEAMEDYLRRLGPDGIVTVVVGDLSPPDELPPLITRLGLIGLRALERSGVDDPGANIVIVEATDEGRAAHNESALVKKTPFTAAQIARISEFAAENGFRVVYAPGMADSRLSPILGRDEQARRREIDASRFNVDATYDSNPFFYNIARWKNLSPNSGIYFIMPGSFIGQVVLLLMVVQSTLLGAALVIAPLLLGARSGVRGAGIAGYLAYFLALGVGFMFLEISFVQTFVLFLGSPTYALSVTIFSLLLFSSLGSLFSGRFASRPEPVLQRLAPALAVVIVVYTFGLSRLFDAALHLELASRILIAVAAQMPIGLMLGMFMPLGIACIARENPRLVPWAWGVNGVGSVTATTLAVLIAMSAGFRTVSLLAAAIYLAGTALLLRSRHARRRSRVATQ